MIKKEKRSFRNKIQNQFRNYTRIPMIILIILFLSYMTIDLFYQRRFLPYQERNQIIEEINQLKLEIENIFDELQGSNSIQGFLIDEQPSSVVFSFYYRTVNQTQIDFELVLYDVDRNLIFSSLPVIQITQVNHAMNNVLLDRIAISNETTMATSRISALDHSINTIMLGRSIGDGYAIIYINPNYMSQFLGYRYANHMVITDRFGYVIATTATAFVGLDNRFNSSSHDLVVVNDVTYEIRVATSVDNMINVNSILIPINIIQEFLGVAVFLILLFILLSIINRRFSNQIANDAVSSIDQLLEVVDEIQEGDLDARVNMDSNDEFELLGNQFNNMLDEINMLIENNRRLEELKRNAQIKQLEAQFDPHFLFNTLEVTRYLIVLDPAKAQEMIVSLTSLLRYSIDNTLNEVPFEDDLKYIEDYLEIIKKRLQENFEYRLFIDDDVNGLLIPKLIIQPIIENSIKYGYQHNEQLVVDVKAYCKDEMLFIEIIDNGSGIEQEMVEQLQKIFLDVNNETNYYGLYSVNQRLKLMYGEESVMEIQSDDSGTKVVIVIPKRYRDV